MGALAQTKPTIEEYLALDRAAELKCEYHDGEFFPLASVSFRHARIASGVASCFRTRLRGTGWQEAISPIRVRVSPTKYVYPDIVVVCGEPSFTDEQVDTLTDMKLAVEVISPSTEDYDYGGKFAFYRRLESFSEYLLVSQSEAKVEIFRKQSPTSWTLDTIAGLDASVKALDIDIPLAEIYEGIVFDPA